MARFITFDVDQVIEVAQKLSGELPGLIETAGLAGMPIPDVVSKYHPLLGMLAQLAGKVMPAQVGDDFGKGFPDTGPLGKGCARYIRKGRCYNDSEVVEAFTAITQVLKQGSKADFASDLRDRVNFTLSLMYPESIDHTDGQIREAIDKMIDGDGMRAETSNKLGDLLLYCLTQKRASKSKQTEESEDK